MAEGGNQLGERIGVGAYVRRGRLSDVILEVTQQRAMRQSELGRASCRERVSIDV